VAETTRARLASLTEEELVAYERDHHGDPSARSSSSSSIRAVLGGRPSSSRTMRRIARSSRSLESMTLMSRMGGA
jgi:hypothetical protein